MRRAVTAGFEVYVEEDEVNYYQESPVSEMTLVDSRHGAGLTSLQVVQRISYDHDH